HVVADEAAITLDALGHDVTRIDDVGVAGVHRLLDRADDLAALDVLIVVAGMEGALPTAVAGLVDTPLVAVPTSTGYGSSFDGMTALAAMTASCAPGVSVVGIDNGFGAACVVARWMRERHVGS
ncbi:MAG: AIR carboxylase family protein, partial [Ilumatobacter fluminis]